MKYKLVLVTVFILMLQACNFDPVLHKEVLSNINKNTYYALYEKSNDIDKNKIMKKGMLGEKFLNCFNHFKREINPGGVEHKHTFEILADNGKKYYYSVYLNGHNIRYMFRWKEKSKNGFSGGGSLIKVKCSIKDLS